MAKAIKPSNQKNMALEVGFYGDHLKSTQAVPCGGLHSYLKHGLNEEMAKREMYNFPRAKVADQQMFQGGYTFCMGRDKE